MTTKKMLKDNKATSPAIATLVLIVIAVVAAAGVGVIVMNIQTQTEGQAGGKDLSVSGPIDIQGSTTVLPFALEAAKDFMEDHPAVEISVSGGGSTHGKNMAKENKIDIGMASSRATVTDIIQETAVGAVLYETEIGKRMIVVIVNDGSAAKDEYDIISGSSANQSISFADLKALYQNGTAITGTTVNFSKAFDRSDSSGTEEGFAKWLGLATGTENQLNKHSTVEGKVGNPGVLAAVAANTGSIGFVDLGYVDDTTNEKWKAKINGTSALATNYDTYDTKSNEIGGDPLTSKLYFYTYGIPTGATDAFINFCLGTGPEEGQAILEEVGLIKL